MIAALAPVARYTRWLHTRWPAGTVEKLPVVAADSCGLGRRYLQHRLRFRRGPDDELQRLGQRIMPGSSPAAPAPARPAAVRRPG